MPVILRTDGTMEEIEELEPTLDKLQAAVSGLIQYVPTHDGGFLYCNDEGKLMGLPVNIGATIIANTYSGDYVVGDVVIYSEEEAKELQRLEMEECE